MDNLEIYEGISESTLALLGLQEISYRNAKNALIGRVGQTVGKVVDNTRIHNAANSDSNSPNKNLGAISSIQNIRNAKGLSGKVAAGAKMFSAEKAASNQGAGITDIIKSGKKVWRLHKAIERKEARNPGWKESTK